MQGPKIKTPHSNRRAGGRLRLLTQIVIVCSLAWANTDASSQSCYNPQIIPTGSCTRNPSPDPFPSGISGSPIDATKCASTSNEALASLYAYEPPSCARTVSGPLEYEADAIDYLPHYTGLDAEERDFHGAIYCDKQANKLVLAYRGTAGFDSPSNSILDWENNILQHIGMRADQYMIASDVAEQVGKDWKRGYFDNKCGPGRPAFILTGHSKAGGQAQFAAKEFRLKAVVFNSDLVNPTISTESFFKPPYDALEPNFIKFIDILFHFGEALVYCRRTDFDNRLQSFMNYNVRDVRMVNDPLVWLIQHCNLPHAPIEWISDTSTCSVNHGHAIATVVRELQVCAAFSDSAEALDCSRRGSRGMQLIRFTAGGWNVDHTCPCFHPLFNVRAPRIHRGPLLFQQSRYDGKQPPLGS